MRSLADRVLAALPSFPTAPMAKDMAPKLHVGEWYVREAFHKLEAEGRAKIVRRGNGLHLVPADYPGRICIICRAEFRPVAKATVTCSHSCARHLAWRNEDMRKRQSASVKAARAKPGERERFSRINKERMADPKVREAISERNRSHWADPVKKMHRVLGMEAAWQGPQGEPRKAKARAKKNEFWSDPEKKAKAVAAMRSGRRGRYKRAVISLLEQFPDITDEEIAERNGQTLEQTKILMRRLFREGLIARLPVDGRKKQRPEVIAWRVAQTKITKAMRAQTAPPRN